MGGVGRAAGARYSVRDLLAHATVVSFLTSYDYESYGNPIGEAIASGVAYLTTRYEVYDAVYGSKGFRAPILEPGDDLPDGAFLDEVAELLTDEQARYEVVLVDNNSTDDTVAIARRFADTHPDLTVEVILEPEQGVACARRTGMAFASKRSRGRVTADEPFYLVSAPRRPRHRRNDHGAGVRFERDDRHA